MKLQLSVFATIALTASTVNAVAGDPPPYLAFNAYGTNLEIANTEVEYDQNQNHAGGIVPIVSDDHTTLSTKGNRWSAYRLPEALEVRENSVLNFKFDLNAATVSGFQAICLDNDLELTGDNGQCFVLSTTQGWVSSMLNVAKLTPVGGSTHHSIPIGHFFKGPVNYIAFLQDSDGDAVAKAAGDSSISLLELVEEDRNKLKIMINDKEEELLNHQVSYRWRGADNQDTKDWLMAISEDGKGVQMNGNLWKALPLNAPYTITHYTVLEFDLEVTEPGEWHAICLDDDTNQESNEKNCITFMTPENPSGLHFLTTEIVANTPQRLVIPFGQILGVLEDLDSYYANYIVFLQDNDKGDKRGGRATFSNMRLYEEDRVEIAISLFGENVTIPNVQEALTSSKNHVQDSIDHVLSVSADGKTIGASGNLWRKFELDAPFEVKRSTVLKFDFYVPHEAEVHALCLLNSPYLVDNRGDCFAPSGRDLKQDDSNWKLLSPYLHDGEKASYEVLVGSYFTGSVDHLGIVLDNDAVHTTTRAEGESYISNIVIYDLPSLNVALDGNKRTGATSFAAENSQVSYDQNQDSLPVRDHLVEVSTDGTTIRVYGNAWRALPVTPTKSAAELGDFVVSFDYILREKGELHGICFEDNLEFGDVKNPRVNEYDPKRCIFTNVFETVGNPNYFLAPYQPAVGEPHRFVLNLGKMFQRFNELKYIVVITDNDVGDKSGGDVEFSNIQITTSLSSCLEDTNFNFDVSDCTVENFLGSVKTKMDNNECLTDDPLLELMALFDLKNEMEVYKKINFICSSSYESSEFDFSKAISSESQLVKEFIDGGTVLNYEKDSEGSSLAKDSGGIASADTHASSKLMSWPKHHALDQCDVGAAMCCWIDSRGTSALEDNSDVCYVDMKASRRTAHVADGYSIYGDSHEGAVNCHGFAWGTDSGSISSALKGNALYKVGFLDGLYKNMNVEQVPGAPMCGCMDRMPVVTNASCTKVTDVSSKVTIKHSSASGFSSVFTGGTIVYSPCSDDDASNNLKSYYKTLVGDTSADAAYIDTRLVGEGNCHGAINGFLDRKGLIKTA